MTTRTHNYKNAYTEEKIDDNGNVLSYKQWNDDVLIIHREWKYDSNNRKIQFLDLFTNYISNSSYHKLGNITIKNSWDSDGRNSKFYSE